MTKRLIFDIDNTLIVGTNFAPYICLALGEYGVHDYNKTLEFMEGTIKYSKTFDYYSEENYLKFFSELLNENLDKRFLKILFRHLRECIPDKDYNKTLKKSLKELQEFELVLLSNYFEKSQRGRLETMGVNQFFKEFYGEKISKPNVRAYIQAAGHHPLTECVIIGDDKKLDIDVPSEIGFKTVYVNKEGIGDVKSVCEITPDFIKKLEYKRTF